jgi:pimeloyl-ACP methyl ester carboxylesterase
VLFSHGAMSAPDKYAGLIGAWVNAGYDVFAPLHVDSLEHPDTARYTGFASWRARIEDMRALAHHVDAKRYVAAGHSYGGLVALTLGGASPVPPAGIVGPLRDPRVCAALAFSPPAPIPGLIAPDGYASLAVPALIQTGDRDVPPGASGPDGWKSHLLAFDSAAPGGDRYALVLEGVDHYFGGAICKFDYPGPPQSIQLAQAAAVSTLFLDTYSAGRSSARRALAARLSDRGAVQLRRR